MLCRRRCSRQFCLGGWGQVNAAFMRQAGVFGAVAKQLRTAIRNLGCSTSPWPPLMMRSSRWINAPVQLTAVADGEATFVRNAGRVMSKIEFKSHVPVAQKAALEALLFFNACQERVSASYRRRHREIRCAGDRRRSRPVANSYERPAGSAVAVRHRHGDRSAGRRYRATPGRISNMSRSFTSVSPLEFASGNRRANIG